MCTDRHSSELVIQRPYYICMHVWRADKGDTGWNKNVSKMGTESSFKYYYCA